MEPATTPPTLLDLSTYLLATIGRTARGRLNDRLAARGFRLWHMAILAALADFGPHAQRDLARRLSIDPSDITKLVDELVASGCAERTRDPADRRRVAVTLTEEGRKALTDLNVEAAAVQDEVLAPLSAPEREQLAGLLGRVLAGLGEG
ncbi:MULTISPECIES: MarR family winged helix-turn-helix transcriptional regulator [Streptomyces]|uniref:MarR family winged helix-turn-helix transcriptional regulator n=1 Tax=Streptomyces ehimensis TaxID=68195 RepID=A0ABV9BFH6_9ACTN